jgi:predicted nucleic acid-binding Zn ribbon protein
MTDPLDSVVRIKDLLGDAGRRLGLPAAVETGAIWSRWTEIVGPAVAAHAEPSSLKAGVLRVRADSPAWTTEIGYLKDEIKAAVNRVVGLELVEEVRLWTGPGAIGGTQPGRAGRGTAPMTGSGPVPDGDVHDPNAAVARARAAWARHHQQGARHHQQGA